MAGPPIDRLADDDMVQLAAEASGTRAHFAAVVVLDGEPTAESVRALVESRLGAVPRLRQRLVRAPYGRPIWVDDPGFDVARQIGRVPCRAPDDRAALLAITARIVEARLSLARPPWRIGVVTGLAGRRAALVVVLHHVLADGLAGLTLLSGLVDGPAPPLPEPRPWPTAAQLRADAWARRRRLAAGLPVLPGRLWAAGTELFSGGLHTAPRCSINVRPVGERRALAVAEADLTAVIDAARGAGATVNDVVLTAATGALARYLAGCGETPERLVVSMPVAARRRAGLGLGNSVGVLPVSLPLTGSPQERLPMVAAVTRARKTEVPGASSLLYGPSVRILAGIGGFGAFVGHQRLVNTFVTNVRGPSDLVTLGGSRVIELIPVSAISGNVGVAFAVLSYAGRLTVTVVADPDLCPDVDLLAGWVQDQLDALTH